MGIAELWDILKPGLDERIAFDIFVGTFVLLHNRPPRLVIDGQLLLFQSNHSEILTDEANTIKRNFMAKLHYLISLNVSLVVVFDGAFKPNKLRCSVLETELGSYEDEYAAFKRSPTSFYKENINTVEEIKALLLVNTIDYIQAPGEAEAQCAYLQRCGVFDYVLSDDVDTLVFGATAMLRKFNRSKPDSQSPTKATKYYVSPVHMSTIEEHTGLNTQRLVLLATLRGGDYSKGVERFGIRNAYQVVVCDTDFAAYKTKKLPKGSPKKPKGILPEFSKSFLDCFVKKESQLFCIWESMQNRITRTIKLGKFITFLNKVIQENSTQIFGRCLRIESIFIEEYYTMLYLFPIVTPGIFKFIPRSLSYGEFISPVNELTLPTVWPACETMQTEILARTNSEEIIGYLRITYSNRGIVEQEFNQAGSYTNSNSLLPIPDNFSGSVRSIIVKLTGHDEGRKHIRVTNSKLEGEIELLMVKFDPQIIGEMFPKTKRAGDVEELSPTKDTLSPTKLDYLWIPKVILQQISQEVVNEYDQYKLEKIQRLKSKKSPIKQLQKTTLDYFPGFISPEGTNPLNLLTTIGEQRYPKLGLPPKLKVSSSPKRRKNSNVSPGQCNIVSFFKSGEEHRTQEEKDPFVEGFTVQKENQLSPLTMNRPILLHPTMKPSLELRRPASSPSSYVNAHESPIKRRPTSSPSTSPVKRSRLETSERTATADHSIISVHSDSEDSIIEVDEKWMQKAAPPM